MGEQSPPFRRRQLGRTLRDLREAAGIAPSQACARLEFSPARLSRMETGQTAPDIVVVKSMLDLYGVPVNAWEPFVQLARDARRKGWWQVYGLSATGGYVGLEAAASSVREFALAFVPGLLQTEDYIRAVLATSIMARTQQRLDNDVAVRLRRQRRLTTDGDDLHLAAVIDETALQRPVGSATVMRDQLGHLVMMAELPNVDLRVVPTSIGAHAGMASGLTVLGFPGEADGDIAYIEHAAGQLQIEKADDVRTCILKFERLRAAALDQAASVAVLERLLDQH